MLIVVSCLIVVASHVLFGLGCVLCIVCHFTFGICCGFFGVDCRFRWLFLCLACRVYVIVLLFFCCCFVDCHLL